MSNLRWIEEPEAVGLRFVGLAHEVSPANYEYLRNAVEHTGWYTDDNGFGETVSGVVYQVSGKKGQARYVVGHADPWNSDSAGRGPARLDVSRLILEEVRDSEWETKPRLRDAARAADHHAELMAEGEREHEREWRAGMDARGRAKDMCHIAGEWTEAMRTVFDLFAVRNRLGQKDRRAVRAAMRVAVRTARKTYDSLVEARREFHESLEFRPSESWREGYGSGGV